MRNEIKYDETMMMNFNMMMNSNMMKMMMIMMRNKVKNYQFAKNLYADFDARKLNA